MLTTSTFFYLIIMIILEVGLQTTQAPHKAVSCNNFFTLNTAIVIASTFNTETSALICVAGNPFDALPFCVTRQF
jgi:hypothetical protein